MPQYEYEDILDYTRFGVRVPQHMIYALPSILEEMVEKQYERVRCCRLHLEGFRAARACKPLLTSATNHCYSLGNSGQQDEASHQHLMLWQGWAATLHAASLLLAAFAHISQGGLLQQHTELLN